MDEALPPELVEERDALIAEIYAAFEGVTREGGVSWGEARVLDAYGSKEECAVARRNDTERGWTALVDEESWVPDSGMGGFCFLDAIGFIYYLPPAMIRCIRTGYDEGIEFHLGSPHSHLYDPPSPELGRSRLDLRQAQAIRRFLKYMVAVEIATQYGGAGKGWARALESYWESVGQYG